jgi:hypothetical protein
MKLLAKYKPIDDRELDNIVYKTRVPAVAPMAYLNVLFKPAEGTLRNRRVKQLGIPNSLVSFYERFNGASLLSGSINIFGFVPDNYVLDRANWFEKRLPLNILEINKEFGASRRNCVFFADYGYDRSLVCIEKQTQIITCFVGEDFRRVRQTWDSFNVWLEGEINRLSFCFDENGNRLVPEEQILPGTESQTVV